MYNYCEQKPFPPFLGFIFDKLGLGLDQAQLKFP